MPPRGAFRFLAGLHLGRTSHTRKLALVGALELVFGRDFYGVARFGGGGLGLAKRLLGLVAAAAAFDSPAAFPPPPTATAAPHAATAAVAAAAAVTVTAALVRVLGLVGAAGLGSQDLKRLLALVASAATPRHLRGALVAALPLLAGPRLPEDAAGGDDAGGALGRCGAWSSGRQLNPAGARGRSGSFALKPGGPAVPSAIPSASRALAGALLAAAAPSAAASALASEERAAALRALPPPSCFFCLGGRGQAGGSSLEQAGQGEADALRMPFKAWPFETAYQVRCFNGYKLERESLHSLSTLPLGANYYFKKSLLSFYASTLFPSSVSLSV